MLGDLNDLTIVIPTYNREQIIRKSIKYWESLGVRVLVLDGSDQRIFADGLLSGHSRISYFSFPKISIESEFFGSYGRRMRFAASNVTTKYVALCADDDFLLNSGVVKALRILESNSSLDAVTRPCVDYRIVDTTVRWNIEYLGWEDKEFGQSDEVWVRVKKSDRGLINYYSIVRTEKWKTMLEICFEHEFSNKLVNQMLMDEVGKILLRTKVLEDVLIVRQFNSPLKYRNLDQDLDHWLRDKTNLIEINCLIDQLHKAFLTVDIDNVESRDFMIHEILKFYGSRTRGFKHRLMVLLVFVASQVPSKIRIGINRLSPQKLTAALGYRGKIVDDSGMPLAEFCELLELYEIQFSESEFIHLSQFLKP